MLHLFSSKQRASFENVLCEPFVFFNFVSFFLHKKGCKRSVGMGYVWKVVIVTVVEFNCASKWLENVVCGLHGL